LSTAIFFSVLQALILSLEALNKMSEAKPQCVMGAALCLSLEAINLTLGDTTRMHDSPETNVIDILIRTRDAQSLATTRIVIQHVNCLYQSISTNSHILILFYQNVLSIQEYSLW
jgi:hypothetical protein